VKGSRESREDVIAINLTRFGVVQIEQNGSGINQYLVRVSINI